MTEVVVCKPHRVVLSIKQVDMSCLYQTTSSEISLYFSWRCIQDACYHSSFVAEKETGKFPSLPSCMLNRNSINTFAHWHCTWPIQHAHALWNTHGNYKIQPRRNSINYYKIMASRTHTHTYTHTHTPHQECAAHTALQFKVHVHEIMLSRAHTHIHTHTLEHQEWRAHTALQCKIDSNTKHRILGTSNLHTGLKMAEYLDG